MHLQLNFTSTGPAYIIGLGKIANSVDVASKSPSLSTVSCCKILVCNGTSSSFVQPPKGCNSSTGFLNPLSSNKRFLVSYE